MFVFVILPNMQRVAVFIDHSNVFHRLNESGWSNIVTTYNPKILSEKLIGSRELVKVMFYCSPPPPTLQATKPNSFERQEKYIAEITKLNIEIRFANLIRQSDGKYYEKNLDTQMTTDMLMMAFKDEYDVAIIVSNDGDFADAVKNVRELGKRTEVAYFKGSLSFNLRAASDLVRKVRPSYFQDIFQSQTSLLENKNGD